MVILTTIRWHCHLKDNSHKEDVASSISTNQFELRWTNKKDIFLHLKHAWS